MKRKDFSKEILRKLYLKDKLNTYQIANKLKCCQGTIWGKLKKYKIKRRTPYELNSFVPSKAKLVKYYIKKRLSTWEIEKKYGYSRGTVHRKLREYQIKTRDLADSHIIYPRKDFSGDLVEKAYLIGFRLGDLGVRKIYPNSKTITVASGSTIPEQIILIKKLFERYGMIWIKKTKDDKINIQINLNLSFDFLLDKNFPEWVKKDKKYFFSFLAGFTDAEGSITTNDKKAYYSLSNCDEIILNKIKDNLMKFKIHCNGLYLNKRKGKTTFDKYKFNFDYWNLRVHRKKDLLNLLEILKLYIKHKNKVKALNMAVENINLRNEKHDKKKILYNYGH